MIHTTKNNIIIIVFAILLLGCEGTGGDPSFEDEYGYDFTIINSTNKEYTGFILYLGNIKNNSFTPIDSIKNTVKIYKRDQGPRIGESKEDGKWSILGVEEGVFKGVKNINHQGKWAVNHNYNESTHVYIKLFDNASFITEQEIKKGKNISLLIETAGLRIISK